MADAAEYRWCSSSFLCELERCQSVCTRPRRCCHTRTVAQKVAECCPLSWVCVLGNLWRGGLARPCKVRHTTTEAFVDGTFRGHKGICAWEKSPVRSSAHIRTLNTASSTVFVGRQRFTTASTEMVHAPPATSGSNRSLALSLQSSAALESSRAQ